MSVGDLAGLSIDFDSVASHLRGYGIKNGEADGKEYERALPRALELLERSGARCTYFLIAGEAKQHPAAVRSIAEAGHEIGCHSMTHLLPFALGNAEQKKSELRDAKHLLEDLAGSPVTGFRAPGWDVSGSLLEDLVEVGYTYDASSFPSWMLLLHRMTVRRKSEGGGGARASALQLLFGRAAPHLLRLRGGTLVEIPICTTPLLRLPYYHTFRFILPRGAFRLLTALALSRRSAVNYVFHAVDFLGVREDSLDERILRHPGMPLSLGEKLAEAERSLQEMRSAGRGLVPLAAIAERSLRPRNTP